MTKNNFLERARNIHGYKYLYVNIPEKIKLSDKIEISYLNNTFYQTVNKHLLGRCPEKNTSKKTTHDFINEAIGVWGNKYDYSLVEYTGALDEVKIIYNGNIYNQRASSHLLGMSPEFQKNSEKDDYQLTRFEISSFLSNHKINFVSFQKFKDGPEFDFYIPSMRICIELGLFEKAKSDYCEENYINLIRIKFDQLDQMEQILWESLKIFIEK